jgi:hypothetical protein
VPRPGSGFGSGQCRASAPSTRPAPSASFEAASAIACESGILGRFLDATEVVSRPPTEHDDIVGQRGSGYASSGD